jgi:hypothetical protein
MPFLKLQLGIYMDNYVIKLSKSIKYSEENLKQK